jgi:formylglycine-generating enzyme required for sulfatase activity
MKVTYVFLLILLSLFTGCAPKANCDATTSKASATNTDPMSLIIGGKYLMGTTKDYFKDKPLSGVYVGTFYIDKTEVTNAMYTEYLGTLTCPNKPPKYIDDADLGGEELPIVDVSYEDAKNYCKYYGKRLPTEAEWEYVARGKYKNKAFPWGNKESKLQMNFRDSAHHWAIAVKSYPPNKYGVYDMAGNVREWVEDTYRRDYYTLRCSNEATQTFSLATFMTSQYNDCRINPVNQEKGRLKVNRGGSWHYTNGYPNTVSFRSFDLADYKSNDLGFRCARDLKMDNILTQKFKEYKTKLTDELGIDTDALDVSEEELNGLFDGEFDAEAMKKSLGDKIQASPMAGELDAVKSNLSSDFTDEMME